MSNTINSIFYSKENILLFIAMLSFILITIYFFPSFFTAIDEHEYLKNALLLKNKGTIIEENIFYSCNSKPIGNGFVASYFIGKSFFLIPFTFFGLNAVMLSGLLIHLINFFLIILILRKLNIGKIFSFLYLFLPVLFWESRTLYPELLVLTFLLAAFYFFLSEKKLHWFFCGLMLGFAVMTRYDAIFALIAFFFAVLFEKERKEKIIFLIAGSIPIGLIILAFNQIFYSGILSTGYGSSLRLLSSFLKAHPETIILSALALLTFYPLMLLSPFITKKIKEKKFIALYALLIVFYLLLNATFTDFLAFDFSLAQLFSIRLRYLVPLIGMLLIPTIALYDEIFERIKQKIKLSKELIATILLLILIIAIIYFSINHTALINSRLETFNFLKEKLPNNALVIGSSDDCMYFLQGMLLQQKYLRVDLSTDFKPLFEDKDIYSFIEKTLKEKNEVYIVSIDYTYRQGRESKRQQLIENERKKIIDFIKENKDKIKLIAEINNKTAIKLYRWKND